MRTEKRPHTAHIDTTISYHRTVPNSTHILIELEKILQTLPVVSILLLRDQIGVNTNFCCSPSQTA